MVIVWQDSVMGESYLLEKLYAAQVVRSLRRCPEELKCREKPQGLKYAWGVSCDRASHPW